MIGFIKKDLAMIKSNFKLLGILIVTYSILGLLGKLDISFLLPFITVMIMISTFSYDNYNNWDAYSICLPKGRKNGVKAKYMATIIIILVISFITGIISLLISYLNFKVINYEQILITLLGTIFGTLLVITFMYPIIYKYGIEKARISIFLIIFGLFILIGFISKYIDFTFISNILSLLENYIIPIIIILMILMVYISYKISARIFWKKEF